MGNDHQFPPEIIYEILSKLPIKSLARFRCVNKLWLEYINDPYLETIHVKEEPTPIIFQHIPYVLPKKINKQCKISFLRVMQDAKIVQNDPVLEFHYKDLYNDTQENLVLGSCNGLTLVWYVKDIYDHGTLLALINPLSKDRYNLPPVKIRSSHVDRFYPANTAGIGFDDSTNTLKTVCVVLKETSFSTDINVAREHLCTLVYDTGMSSWRDIGQIPAYPISGEGIYAHGRLHWLVSSHWWSLEAGTKVVWFDVRKEEFGLIEPPKRKGGFWIDDQLVDLNGEVGFAYVDDIRIELWVLKEEEWVLHCRIDLRLPLYLVVVSGCWNKEGDILFTSDGGRRLFVYTLKTGDLREVDWGDECDADVRMYRSSFFSMNTSGFFHLKAD